MLKYEDVAMLDDADLLVLVNAKRFAPVKPVPQPIDWAALATRARTTTPTMLGE